MLTRWRQELQAKLPKAGQKLLIAATESSRTAFALSQLHQVLPDETTLLVVTASEKEAKTTQEDLSCFINDLKVLHWPSRRLHLHRPVLLGEAYSAQRASVLDTVNNSSAAVIVCSYESIRQQTLPTEWLTKYTVEVTPGSELDLERLTRLLAATGYRRQPLVRETGQFAVRGGIIDLFPPNEEQPCRIELFGDTVESLRYFDTNSQRSTQATERLRIIPFSEIIHDQDTSMQAQSALKKVADEHDIPKKARTLYHELLATNTHTQELEDLLPLFYPDTALLFDYLPKDFHVAFINRLGIEEADRNLDASLTALLEKIGKQGEGFFHPEVYADSKQVMKMLDSRSVVLFEDAGHDLPVDTPQLQITLDAIPKEKRFMTERLKGFLRQGYAVHIICDNETQREKIARLFLTKATDTTAKNLHLSIGSLQHGFFNGVEKFLYIPDREIFGIKQKRRPVTTTPQPDSTVLAQLKEGSYVVHIDHGIGLYHGLQHLEIDGQESDFLRLEYRGGDRLYLPIYRMNVIQPYATAADGEAGDAVQLDRLGSNVWAKRKAKVHQAIRDMTQALLKLYASRKVIEGFAHTDDDPIEQEFAASFPFTETHDQARTIDEVLTDMETPRPMDRLVCGDVGFGKTEVALRAAFRAILAGKQVAVLVPTTLLAEQHFHTFSERLRPFAANVATLSRFRSSKQIKQTLQELKSGEVDVVVGTHRMLSKDVQFKDLSLLIIDEEHRFGVSHKEKIKQYRAKIDVISMTATPIPRSLQMSLHGFRDLSVIETPPADRQSVQTFIARFDDDLIRNAIISEVARGGQVFFVHNRVQTISAMKKYLTHLVPEVSIGIVHGETPEREAERVMLAFLRQEVAVLLATTIIESGLDFPMANTIIINRADRFGLAQLYQLRGRVGRSNREAFAYLLIPGDDLISQQAQKRLSALRAFTQLGSGYRIALRDLEIRGAGNLLGTKQSGHIRAVGMELYNNLLQRCVRELQGQTIEEEIEPELQLKTAAFIPKDYIADESVRLYLYRRIAGCHTTEEIDLLNRELKDRFGSLPKVVENLLEIVGLRLLARKLRLKRLTAGKDGLAMEFDRSTKVKPENLATLLGDREVQARMHDAHTLLVPTNRNHSDFNLDRIKKLLQRLT